LINITLGQSLQHTSQHVLKEEKTDKPKIMVVDQTFRTGFYAWFPWRESFVMVPMMSMLFIGPQATLEPDHID
jgi:hypothetical protein